MSSRPTDPPATSTSGRRLWLTDGPPMDPTSPDAFDALADLFLGEVSKPRRMTGETEREEVLTRPSPPATDHPRLRLISPEDAGEETAEPEEHAGEARASEVVQTPAFVECIVLGNLPVLASAWGSQYVREIASASGRPVAAMRLQAGYITVELVGDVAQIPSGIQSTEQAILAAAGITNRWIVRVDHAQEAGAAASPFVHLVTLLTGVDETARARAYASIKSLAENLPEGAGPAVRVAMMAAPSEQADAAAGMLLGAVREHLGREVQHAVCSSKIHASRPAALLFNGKTDLNPLDLLELLGRLAHVHVRPANAAAIPLPSAVPSTPVRVEPREEVTGRVTPLVPLPIETSGFDSGPSQVAAQRDQVEPAAEDRVGGTMIATTLRTTGPMEPAVVTPAPAVPLVPLRVAASSPPLVSVASTQHTDDVALWAQPAPVVPLAAPSAATPTGAVPADARTDGQPTPPPLASHLAELKPLTVRCPYAQAVEFARDAGGELHLLAATAQEDDERTLAALMVASNWTSAHAPLLAAALPGVAVTQRPTLHLFTAKPKSSRRLLETELRVHLLASVRVGAETAWYCTELN